MDWWAPIVGIGLSLLVPLLRDRLRDAVGRRRVARIAQGREGRVPVLFGLPGRLQRADVVRDGDDLVVVGGGARVAVPARALADPATGTWHVEGRDEDIRRRFTLTGPGDVTTHLEVPEHLVPALLELARRRPSALLTADGPTRSTPRRRPGVAVGVGLLLTVGVLLGAVGFQLLYATGTDVVAHVDDVVRHEDAVNGYDCHVSWTDPWQGSRRTAVVDCEDPVQRVGSSTTVHAIRYVWPGTAMDLAGSYEALSGLSLGALVATGLPTLLLWRRRRRAGSRALVGRAEPARSAPVPRGAADADGVPRDADAADAPRAPAAPDTPSTPDDDDDSRPLVELARLATLREHREDPSPGWERIARPTLPRLLLSVVTRQAGWGIALVVLGAALAGLWDSAPGWVLGLGLALTAGTAVAVVARSATTLVRLSRLRHAPVTAELDVVGLMTPDDQQLALLCTGTVARWLVGVPVNLGHGRRAGVRGDLEQGLVLLVVDGHDVMTTTPAREVDADLEDDLRGMLDFVLEGYEPVEGSARPEADRGAVRGRVS